MDAAEEANDPSTHELTTPGMMHMHTHSHLAIGTYTTALARLCAGPLPLTHPPMEVSVHRTTPALAADLATIFPSARLHAASPVHVVLTFQCAADGMDLARGPEVAPRVAAEMDRLLDVFVQWQGRVREALLAQGHWCDAIDPRWACGCCMRIDTRGIVAWYCRVVCCCMLHAMLLLFTRTLLTLYAQNRPCAA